MFGFCAKKINSSSSLVEHEFLSVISIYPGILLSVFVVNGVPAKFLR